jgi:2-keto-4-pentenoate hydratase
MLANYDARAQSTCDVELLDLTTHEAYALQAEIARLREQRGERVIGYKVGCTSQTIQHQLGVNEPILGRLFEAECHRGEAPGTPYAIIDGVRYGVPGTLKFRGHHTQLSTELGMVSPEPGGC